MQGQRSERTVRTVKPILPSEDESEIFQVPLMRCNLRTVNSSIRTVCEVNGPNGLYGPSSRFLPKRMRVKYSSPTDVVATGQEMVRENKNSSRSGKRQGISFWVRENWHFEEKSGKIEIVRLI